MRALGRAWLEPVGPPERIGVTNRFATNFLDDGGWHRPGQANLAAGFIAVHEIHVGIVLVSQVAHAVVRRPAPQHNRPDAAVLKGSYNAGKQGIAYALVLPIRHNGKCRLCSHRQAVCKQLYLSDTQQFAICESAEHHVAVRERRACIDIKKAVVDRSAEAQGARSRIEPVEVSSEHILLAAPKPADCNGGCRLQRSGMHCHGVILFSPPYIRLSLLPDNVVLHCSI